MVHVSPDAPVRVLHRLVNLGPFPVQVPIAYVQILDKRKVADRRVFLRGSVLDVRRVRWESQKHTRRTDLQSLLDVRTTMLFIRKLLLTLPINTRRIIMRESLLSLAEFVTIEAVKASDRGDRAFMVVVELQRDEVSDHEECVVCLETFESGSEVGRLPCRHLFHHDCIRKWLRNKHSCPLCRSRVPFVSN